jgi:hypothetical protein
MSWSRKAYRLLIAVTLIGAVAIALPAALGARAGSVVAIVTIQGEPVLASTLTAIPLPDDPDAAVEYRWQRCAGALRSGCAQIEAAGNSRSYTVTAADVGSRLAVRAVYEIAGLQLDVWSALTSVVTAPAPAPPGPEPTATFDGASRPAAPVAMRPPRFLRPFPVVRIKGTLLAGGARVSLLRVKAPRTATVDARCDGSGCHVRSRTTGSCRIGALERFLRAGTRITIRVFKPDAVGKYVRFVIRDGAAPARRDACLLPGSARPAACPVPELRAAQRSAGYSARKRSRPSAYTPTQSGSGSTSPRTSTVAATAAAVSGQMPPATPPSSAAP